MKLSSQSIVILTCYFGEWPWYFSYFLHSCKYNPSVDFIVITDNTEGILNKPKNVIFLVKTLKDIESIATAKMGFAVSLNNPYKLCDFKPAYGFLFPEIIERYSFWGHGDLDVIYGNIRNFISDQMLSEFELITARHDFLSGAFTLFKNNEKMNTLFMESKDYKKVFSSSIHYCFDECNFLWKQIGNLKNEKTIFDLPSQIESMTHVVKKMQRDNKLNAFFDFMIVEGVPGNLKWVNGKVIFKNTFEALLYHLIKFKKVNTASKNFEPIPLCFNISKTKIYKQ